MDTYTIRIATSGNIKRFAETEKAELMLRVLFEYRDQGHYQLHGFAVMPEHLHVLLTPSRNHPLEGCVLCITGGFLDEVNTPFPGRYWQPGFREDWIRDGEDFRKQLAHIAANPERRGFVYWDFVHTRFSERLDPMPERLRRYPDESDLGSGFSGIPVGERGAAESTGAAADERDTREANFAASHRLRELYINVVKLTHPDLASSEADRTIRERLTKEANIAFEQGDDATLRRVLEECESRAHRD
jgi:putative transposase